MDVVVLVVLVLLLGVVLFAAFLFRLLVLDLLEPAGRSPRAHQTFVAAGAPATFVARALA